MLQPCMDRGSIMSSAQMKVTHVIPEAGILKVKTPLRILAYSPKFKIYTQIPNWNTVWFSLGAWPSSSVGLWSTVWQCWGDIGLWSQHSHQWMLLSWEWLLDCWDVLITWDMWRLVVFPLTTSCPSDFFCVMTEGLCQILTPLSYPS